MLWLELVQLGRQGAREKGKGKEDAKLDMRQGIESFFTEEQRVQEKASNNRITKQPKE